VDVNGERATPHRALRAGDHLLISRPFGRRQTVVVVALTDRHVKRSEARAMYDDQTPKPTAEEIEMRRTDRLYRAAAAAAGTDRRKRREMRRIKGTDY
jgi:hypothetical protein